MNVIADVLMFCRCFVAVLPSQLSSWGWLRGWRLAVLWSCYGVVMGRDARLAAPSGGAE